MCEEQEVVEQEQEPEVRIRKGNVTPATTITSLRWRRNGDYIGGGRYEKSWVPFSKQTLDICADNGVVMVVDLAKVRRVLFNRVAYTEAEALEQAAKLAGIAMRLPRKGVSLEVDGEVVEALKGTGARVNDILQTILDEAVQSGNGTIQHLVNEAQQKKAASLREQAAALLQKADALAPAA